MINAKHETNDYYDPILYIIQPQDQGMILKNIMQKRMGISRKLLSRLKMTDQGVMLNGQHVYVSTKVQVGDKLEIRMEREQSDDILPQAQQIDVIYEDQHLLIVNKKAGVIVHPTSGHYTDTLANGVVHYWQERGEKFRFRPVHRLDQDTSGVLAIAKNPYAHQHISEQMINHSVQKRYHAYVHHIPTVSQGRIEGAIDRDLIEPHMRVVTPDGYAAATRYQVLESFADRDIALVELELETGRTHQIRVHMKHIGCPLVGDRLYGYARPDKNLDVSTSISQLDQLAGRQALHAVELGFVHPVTGEEMLFQAPLPEDLANLEAELRGLESKD